MNKQLTQTQRNFLRTNGFVSRGGVAFYKDDFGGTGYRIAIEPSIMAPNQYSVRVERPDAIYPRPEWGYLPVGFGGGSLKEAFSFALTNEPKWSAIL